MSPLSFTLPRRTSGPVEKERQLLADFRKSSSRKLNSVNWGEGTGGQNGLEPRIYWQCYFSLDKVVLF